MKRLTILSIVALVSLSGCQTIRDLTIQNPEYVIRSIRPDIQIGLPLSASAIDFDILLEVRNPNSVGLRLDRIDFDLFVDRQRIVQGSALEGVRIPASGTGDVRLRARLGYNEARGLWTELVDALRGDRPEYEVRGTAFYDTPVGRLNLPFTVLRQRL